MAPVVRGGSANADARSHNNRTGRTASSSSPRGISIRARALGHAAGRRQVLCTRSEANRAWRGEDVRAWSQDAMTTLFFATLSREHGGSTHANGDCTWRRSQVLHTLSGSGCIGRGLLSRHGWHRVHERHTSVCARARRWGTGHGTGHGTRPRSLLQRPWSQILPRPWSRRWHLLGRLLRRLLVELSLASVDLSLRLLRAFSICPREFGT